MERSKKNTSSKWYSKMKERRANRREDVREDKKKIQLQLK
jgi:hypothetical protein